MLFFANDYSEGAHPKVLEHLTLHNAVSAPGYGNDSYCDAAKAKICDACGRDDLDVFFLTGGTQTNQVVISSLLRSYEGVISADTGHINGHEAGAIEYSGHKVLTLPHKDGKISADDVRAYIERFYADHSYTHMVFPGMVYITHPTEYGTLYTKAELSALSAVCREYNIPLYLDGARLAYGLMSRGTDLRLSDITELCDVFYIGGTKIGALCGEAVVFTRGNAPEHFMTLVKQRGAMLAKGRLLGMQFDALFTDGLYFEIGRHAVEMAELMKDVFRSKGITFFIDSPTNQQFVLLNKTQQEKLDGKIAYTTWAEYDEEHIIARFVTSWATTVEQIDALKELL